MMVTALRCLLIIETQSLPLPMQNELLLKSQIFWGFHQKIELLYRLKGCSQYCSQIIMFQWKTIQTKVLQMYLKRKLQRNEIEEFISVIFRDVLKFTQKVVIWKLIWELILEKNHFVVTGRVVIGSLQDQTSLQDIIENTPEWDLSNAITVIVVLQDLITFLCISKGILNQQHQHCHKYSNCCVKCKNVMNNGLLDIKVIYR